MKGPRGREGSQGAEGSRVVTATSSRFRPMTATERVLMYLFNRREATAGCVGSAIWPDRDVRGGRGVSSNGGGDYAAQMLLGRLKKAGLVEHAPSEGSSRWRLTRRGMDAVHEFNR